MAILKHGVNGPVQGKVGTFTGYLLNGKNVIRGLPGKRRKKKVTDKELANRKKFSVAHYWMQPLKPALQVGFKNYGSTTGGYRAALSWCRLNAVCGSHPDFYIDPAQVRISGGDLQGTAFAEAHAEKGGIRFTWDPGCDRPASPNDQVILVAYQPDKNCVFGRIYGAPRQQGTDFVSIPGSGSFFVYLGFLAADRSRQSHSVYLGKVEL